MLIDLDQQYLQTVYPGCRRGATFVGIQNIAFRDII